MPIICAVYSCSQRGANFRIPTVIKGQGTATQELSERRRREWIQQIGRKELTFEETKPYHRVCHRHFISGSPAALWDKDNPDWIPTQHMGHGAARSADVKRFRRVAARRNSHVKRSTNAAWNPESQDCAIEIDEEPSTQSYLGTLRQRSRLKRDAVPSIFPWTRAQTSVQVEREKRKQKQDEAGKLGTAEEAAAEKEANTVFNTDMCVASEEVVCSAPAPVWYRAHPDWVPTVNACLASKKPADAVRIHTGVGSGVSCPNTRKKKIYSQKSFFLFPKDEERCRQWVENVRREDLLHLSPAVFYARKYLLCSDHFQENQFVHNTDRTRLIHDAVPTLFTRPEESLESSVKESDEGLDSSLGPEDVRPVLEEGCLWPSTDHTYCSPSLVKENLEKPNGLKTDARRQNSGSREEKTTWSATDKHEGLGSKIKAKKAQKASKNDAKKSKLCDKIKDQEKTEVCCAVGCRTGHYKSNKSLFVFPVHKARCIEWLQNLERQDLQEKSPHQLRCEGYRVCSDHFEPEHIVHVRRRPQLTRSAVPTLLKPWKRQTQKSRPAEGQHRQPPARRKKNKCRGQAKEHPGSDLLQIKVEIDWAEDPLLHCSTQVLTDPETREERMVLPRLDHTDLSTSSTSAILNHIKSEPVEEGEEMEHIKLEPVEEEERLCGDNRESVDLPGHRSAGCGQSNSVDNGNQSRLQVCVSDIKSEPDSDNMEESHWIQSLHHAASDIKLEPVSDDVAELGRIQSVHHTNNDHINSVEQFSYNSKLTSRKQICSSDEQIHTKPYHTYSKSTASRHGMNSSEHIDSIEQYGGNGTMTFASRLIEENDVEMSYTVVKTEPESDMEEV